VKILIEGEKYPIDLLQDIFSDSKFYLQEGGKGTLLSVGYYHNYEKNLIAYLLPKVFMANKTETVFGIPPNELIDLNHSENFNQKDEFLWVRQITVYFYNSLVEFKKRSSDTSILNASLSYNLNTRIGTQEYSYLDLILSFVNFYKKHKNFITYRNIQQKAHDASKVNWSKIIRNTAPFFSKNGHPIYDIFKSKKKEVNREEELLTYFFSIINHFNNEHKLSIKFDNNCEIITGKKFEILQKNGLLNLRNIKYKYFNDTLRRMYHLCEIYFINSNTSSLRKPKDEFLCVNNYNVVFEDMIDKLFSDEIPDSENKSTSLHDLKYHSDGKILDHIFDHQSLIDTSNIFYIGDSKYYKPENIASKLSQYKQFTYAKNVIQFNIDLLNSHPPTNYKPNIRYRDTLTEGYNITPNFFIFGYISNFKNFDHPEMTEKGEVIKSFHFEDRLFDRDSLFVHQYMINFLFVLKSYSHLSKNKTFTFRTEVKSMFRENFVKFFNSPQKSSFNLYEYTNTDKVEFVNRHFRLLNGKCFNTIDNKLIIAQYISDKSITHLSNKLKPFVLN